MEFLDSIIRGERALLERARSAEANLIEAEQDLVRPFNPANIANPFLAPSRTRSVTPLTAGVDNLRVIVSSAFATTIVVTGLIRQPDGQLASIGPNGFGFTLPPIAGDRVARAFDMGLTANTEILSIVVQSTVANVGPLFAIIQTTRLMSDNTIVVTGVRAADYLTNTRPLSFPGNPVRSNFDGQGFTRSLAFANPAASNEFQTSVPIGARWKLLSLFIQLTTVIGGANRTVLIELSNTALNPIWVLVPAVSQAPATTSAYSYVIGLAGVTGAFGTFTAEAFPNGDFLVPAGWFLNTLTLNFAVGDQYVTPNLTVAEYIDL